MTTVIIHHDIEVDLEHWLTSPKRKAGLEPIGVTNIRTFVDPQNSAHVAFMADVADMGTFMAMMQSETAVDGMRHDGVVLSSMKLLVESSPA